MLFPILIRWIEKKMLFFLLRIFFSYVFVLKNVCREGWTDIVKKRVEVVFNVLFIVNFVSINYEIWWEFLFCCYIYWAIL